MRPTCRGRSPPVASPNAESHFSQHGAPVLSSLTPCVHPGPEVTMCVPHDLRRNRWSKGRPDAVWCGETDRLPQVSRSLQPTPSPTHSSCCGACFTRVARHFPSLAAFPTLIFLGPLVFSQTCPGSSLTAPRLPVASIAPGHVTETQARPGSVAGLGDVALSGRD